MSAEFYDSPEQAPASLHALSTNTLMRITSDTTILSLLHEIQTEAIDRALKNEFDTEADELVLFVKLKIETLLQKNADLEKAKLLDIDRDKQMNEIDATYFDDAALGDEKRVKGILGLFTDKD